MGPVPLLRSPRATEGPSRLHITTYSRSSEQYRTAAHIDKAALFSRQYTYCTSRDNMHDGTRGREQGLIPDRTPKPLTATNIVESVVTVFTAFVVKCRILTVSIHSPVSV